MEFDKAHWAHFLMQLQRFSPDDELERCGAIVYRMWQTGYSLFEMNNEHSDPAGHSRISWKQKNELAEYHPELIHAGWLHVHPGRNPLGWMPSERDIKMAKDAPHTFHTIYHPYSRSLVFYDGLWTYEYMRVRPIRRKNEHGFKSAVAKRHARTRNGLG